MPATPTRRKKRLGILLEQLRTDADKQLSDAAEMLRLAESTISRYETGHLRPSWPTLQALLALYDAGGAPRADAATLWEDADDQAIRIVTPTGSAKPFRAFLRAEAEADFENLLADQVVPGILQTPGYARAINATGQQFHQPATKPERYVVARLSRQARLTGENPLRLHAILDEAVIRRVVGDAEIMTEQLRHLLKVADHQNVKLQVVPFDIGAYGTMSGGFVIIGYVGDEDPPAVYTEHAAGGAWVENRDDVQRFQDVFLEVSTLALTSAKSAQLIKSQVRALE